MDNQEDILDELISFEKRRQNEIPQILEDYLTQIAKTGDTIFPWSKLKPLFMLKMERVIADFYESCPLDNIHSSNVEQFRYDVMKEKLLEAVDNFSSAPFTIQRLCELVTCPRKHYKHTDKFMRGLEKNVLVISTVEPGCSHIYACDCSRKTSECLTTISDGSLNGTENKSIDSTNEDNNYIVNIDKGLTEKNELPLIDEISVSESLTSNEVTEEKITKCTDQVESDNSFKENIKPICEDTKFEEDSLKALENDLKCNEQAFPELNQKPSFQLVKEEETMSEEEKEPVQKSHDDEIKDLPTTF